MKKLFAQILLTVPMWFMLGGISFAMCVWFVPPSRNFAPASNMKTLIVRDGENTSMTVQPQFTGDATSFALVMPFPSEPTVAEAPEAIFTELEDLTNPLMEGTDFATLETDPCPLCARADGVEILEERDVGDFSTVTLSATSESALTTWLENEGYEITDEKRSVIAEYVDSNGFFVALKVNMEAADVDDQGFLQGELKPIRFDFTSTDVQLPLRLMSGDNSLVTLTVYTLADEITYIPGGELQYSKKVDATQLKEAPGLESYDAWQRWLVRNVIQVQTSEIENDVTLRTTTSTRVVVPGERALILNPDQLPAGTGIVISDNGDIVYTEEKPAESPNNAVNTSSNLTNAAVGLLAVTNLILLGLLMVSQNSNAKTTGKK